MKDLLEKVKGLLAKGIDFLRGMDKKKKIIAICGSAALLVLIVVLCIVLAQPGGEQPPAPTTTGPVSTQTTYQVSVKDVSGKPYTAGVIVKFMQNGKQVAMQPVNGNGLAEKTLPNGEYTIELEFTNAANAASYDQKNAVVDVNNPRLELVLMNTISGETVSLFATSPVTGEGRDYLAYHVSTGDTSVPLEKGERSFFLFVPAEAGTYRVTTSSANAAVGYYGAPHFVLPTNAAETVDNAFEISVSKDMIGTNGTGTTTLVIGIDSKEDLAACVLTIERIGDPAWDISQEAWTEYKNVFTPVPFTMGSDASIKEFDLTASTDTYNLVLNEEDGCFHLDSEDGPLVLIRLAEKSAYMESYQKMLETTGVKRYFFDADGKFVKKEDYSANLTAYIECVDEATGMYPLTEDLKYILQNNGEHQGWWNEDGYYLFVDEDGNKIPGINTEIAWLFMCCYDENNSGSFANDPTVPETTEPETTVPETTEAETTEPAETVPETTLPAATEPTVPATTVPATVKPVETKPVATRPSETRPAATRPIVTRPAETVPPTTVPPTTVAPTTVPPTTAAPTTVPPTTVAPTTVPPTTAAPTTVPPITAAPTTVPPTTAAPTTVPPTTAAPTEPELQLGELVEVDDRAIWIGAEMTADTCVIRAGTRAIFDIPRLPGKYYVTIADVDAYILYKEEVYYPENGILSVPVFSEGTAGVQLQIGNAGTSDKAFHIVASRDKGSYANPYSLQMGRFTVEVAEGNQDGVFYAWTAPSDGKLTIKITQPVANVDITVNVSHGGVPAQHKLSDLEGEAAITVDVLAGDQVSVVVSTITDDFGHPAATVCCEAIFE